MNDRIKNKGDKNEEYMETFTKREGLGMCI